MDLPFFGRCHLCQACRSWWLAGMRLEGGSPSIGSRNRHSTSKGFFQALHYIISPAKQQTIVRHLGYFQSLGYQRISRRLLLLHSQKKERISNCPPELKDQHPLKLSGLLK